MILTRKRLPVDIFLTCSLSKSLAFFANLQALISSPGHIKLLLIVNVMFVIVVRNSTDHQKILDEANGKHKMVLDKLNEERALLEVCFQQSTLNSIINDIRKLVDW